MTSVGKKAEGGTSPPPSLNTSSGESWRSALLRALRRSVRSIKSCDHVPLALKGLSRPTARRFKFGNFFRVFFAALGPGRLSAESSGPRPGETSSRCAGLPETSRRRGECPGAAPEAFAHTHGRTWRRLPQNRPTVSSILMSRVPQNRHGHRRFHWKISRLCKREMCLHLTLIAAGSG